MSFELITKNGKTFALVPVREYEQVLAEMELSDDIRALEAALARVERGEDEMVPFTIISRRLAGENPTKIWREFRELTQEQLAQASGISRGMIGAIESGHKHGSVATLKKLAIALGCDIDNLTSTAALTRPKAKK
ncbi:helix-turn-helix transcriptional regulator [Asticcacaulis sp. EMRT-3]|uniref:helix-turn-helix domain-containing protein n=1 Tax=Asticcacaulis sp. EMRT-3 TaxID=3040349 RepID=UPI0024AF8D25|nr:helix-turn-helix transcriptional regulator [Asticcacaulis sp. EMRT-3]MDI7774675.1 helix-turn-helix transcriptional regulator [Asticcacaulis sp. EMRT-3]